jgi:hypothetical protein
VKHQPADYKKNLIWVSPSRGRRRAAFGFGGYLGRARLPREIKPAGRIASMKNKMPPHDVGLNRLNRLSFSLHYDRVATILPPLIFFYFRTKLMSHSKPQSAGTTFKEKVEIVQSIVTIGAVFVGGFWTYDVFIKERREHPHANIEHKISHLALSKQLNLLRVGLDISNTGTSLMNIQRSTIRVQQILPPADCQTQSPCAPNELKEAAAKVDRKEDRFSWPLIAERNVTFDVRIEPGEKQSLDFEFVAPSNVKAVRVYTYVSNQQKNDVEIGWAASSYYDFSKSKSGGEK